MAAEAKIWRTTVLTLFPEMFPGPLGISLAGKALSSGLWALEARDIRASATDRHRSVDDTPAGGGPGMVLRADVLAAAIDAAEIAPELVADLVAMRAIGIGREDRADESVLDFRHHEKRPLQRCNAKL